MRLTSLSLRNYGNFESEDIAFDARPGAINILVAPNGSGKSVLRSAFCDLLFGIGGQTPMGFRFGFQGMQVSADAITSDGERFTFGRRKGHGNTLVDSEGNVLDPVTLARRLGRTDRVLLERLFALDTAKLREGEDKLLATNGALAAALVLGAGDMRDATVLEQTLEAARDALAPVRRSSQRPFYIELEKFATARRQLNASLIRPEQWDKLERERRNAWHQQEEANKRADTISAEISKLERIRRVAPWLAVHEDAVAWLAAHPDAPLLDADLATRLADIRTSIIRTQDRANRDNEQATQLAQQLQPILLDIPLLAAAADVERLVETAGGARKAAADLPVVKSELQTKHNRIAALLRQLGSSVAVSDAIRVIPPRALVARARRLITTWRQQIVASEASRRRVEELTQSLRLADEQLAALPPVSDTHALEALVEEIRAEGDPARRRQNFVSRLEEAELAVARALARVPGWTAGADALLDFAPLHLAAYDRLAADWAAAATDELTSRKQVEEARRELVQAEERLAAITKPGAVVSEHDLKAARAHRDQGWQLIYRQAFTADSPSEDERSGFSRDLPLPLAFERAVIAADEMADSRMRHHAVVVQVEMHHDAVEKAKTNFTEIQERHRLAGETLEATARAWTRVCSALPLGSAPSASEVQAFLATRERVIDAVGNRRAAEQALRALDDQHASWLSDLTAVLEQPPDSSVTLTRSLAAADRAIKSARDAAADRTRVVERRRSTAETLAKERDTIVAAEAATADWIEKWRGLLAELGRPLDEEPEVTDEIIQLLGDLAIEHQAAESLASRISGMSADHDQFHAAAKALAASVASDLLDLPPFTIVTEISQRLRHQRGLERQHILLSAQLKDAQESAAKAAQDHADHQVALREILLVIGADTVEAAEARLVLSTQRRHQEARLADALIRLRDAGQGLSLGQLKAEMALTSVGDIEATIERASRDRKEANEQAQAAAAEVARLVQQMERDAAATTASIALTQQQSAAAAMGRVLEDALIFHVAALLLKRSRNSVEAVGHPALLRRISDLFQMLTNGAYQVYTVADAESKPRLVLQERNFPKEHKEIKALSDGTRDQLFLALRLAAIEEHAATAPPLPFIGDDILQTFDDDRSLAAMRVLLEVSEKVQIILLTHHRHLLDLAARLPRKAIHACILKELVSA